MSAPAPKKPEGPAHIETGVRAALRKGRLPRCWGAVLGNWYTEAHKVLVAPGHYGIAALESDSPSARLLHRSFSQEVTVSAGQTLEVTLPISAYLEPFAGRARPLWLVLGALCRSRCYLAAVRSKWAP